MLEAPAEVGQSEQKGNQIGQYRSLDDSLSRASYLILVAVNDSQDGED
jgi:hypothetical protein